jgi:zinc ribbon protein
MRRRLRRQQRVREALLLDLGALVFELHRQGRREPELLQAKAAELTAVDEEVRGLVDALEVGEQLPQLVAPGIGGSCAACGAILTTDARFCPNCGAAAGAPPAVEHELSEDVPPELDTSEEAETPEPEIPTEEQEALEAGELEPEPEQPSSGSDVFDEVGKAVRAGVRRGRSLFSRRRSEG